MKTLCLLRHAKAGWNSGILNDFDRPLDEVGKAEASVMARRLRDQSFAPELIVTSPAKRARSTAKIFAYILEYPADRIIHRLEIYDQALDGLLAIIQALDDHCSRAMLVGHNPYLSHLAEWLSGEKIGNVPPCGLAAFTFPVDSWQEIRCAGGRLLFYDHPGTHK